MTITEGSLKAAGIVHFLNVQVLEHRFVDKWGGKSSRYPIYVVTLQNLVSKDSIKFESPNRGIFDQYPLGCKFAVEVKTPQSALSDFAEEKKVE